MTTPLFFSASKRRFVLEFRVEGGEWKEYGKYRYLTEAKQAEKEALDKGPGRETRIYNRVTGEFV